MGQRRTFSREFKLEAVKLVRDRNVSVAQAARDLNIHENLLRKWTRQQTADPKSAFPGLGLPSASAPDPRAAASAWQKDAGSRDPQRGPRTGQRPKKTAVARGVATQGRFPVKAVAQTPSVARSNLMVRKSNLADGKPAKRRGRKPLDNF